MNSSTKTIYIAVEFFLAFTLISCGTSSIKEQDEVEDSLIRTEIAATVYAQVSIEETQIPESTNEPTLTPSTIPEQPTSTFLAIDSEIYKDKTEGVWLVGDEIAIGKWRAVGGDCYAVTYDGSNEQLDMSSGIGSIILLKSGVFSVQLVSYPGKCTWTYLDKPTVNSPEAESKIYQEKTEGVWLVGKEIAVGKWRAVGGDCYAVTYDGSNEQMDMSSGVGSIILLNSDIFSVQLVSYPGKCTWTYLDK